MSAPDDERLARAALTRLFEPADVGLHRLLAGSGAVDVWEALRGGADGLPGDVVRRTHRAAARLRPERDLERVDRLGGRLVCPGDGEWPESLLDLDAPPVALWARGSEPLAATVEHSVAIVGARAATSYGLMIAHELGADLGARGWSVVSGGAEGIDGAAHEGCLAAEAPTVVILGCGLDVSYPGMHAGLFRRIASAGLLLSEWPPGCSPRRHRFLIRNRVIAALTRGTVVVEAAVRSGARSTADHALHLGRHVMAVPGPVTSAMSMGCHVLLRNHATCVTCAAEVIEQVGRLGTDLAPPVSAPPTPRDALGGLARRVLDALPKRRFVSPERVAAASGLTVLEVVRELTVLRVAGLAEVSDGGYRVSQEAVAPVPRQPAAG